jgi:hypothetical protein
MIASIVLGQVRVACLIVASRWPAHQQGRRGIREGSGFFCDFFQFAPRRRERGPAGARPSRNIEKKLAAAGQDTEPRPAESSTAKLSRR